MTFTQSHTRELSSLLRGLKSDVVQCEHCDKYTTTSYRVHLKYQNHSRDVTIRLCNLCFWSADKYYYRTKYGGMVKAW